VETFTSRDNWSLYLHLYPCMSNCCMSNANGACLRSPKSNVPPNYPVPTRPRPTETEMIPSATAWPTICSRSWGHGCLLELAWAFHRRDNYLWECRLDEYLSNFALCTRLGATGSTRRNLIISYPVLACISPRVVRPI
jgi:hypothetical protein